jgi:hypothetical protein
MQVTPLGTPFARSSGVYRMLGAAIVGVLLVYVSSGPARGTETLSYDPASIETVRGDVVRVVTIAHPTGTGVHLIVRTEAGEDVAVALGPVQVVERAFRIRPGDRVDITGARVVRGKPTLVACELKKGEQVLRLRDRYGVPLWKQRASATTAP